MSKGTCLAVVLAAGEGTRMKSRLPKVLHRVAGRSLVAHVLYAVKDAAVARAAVVVGPDRADVAAEAGRIFPEAHCYEQRERLGTAHAVLAAREALAEPVDEVLVLFGDTPLVRAETLNEMRAALRDGAAVAVLGFRAADPTGYGRLIVKDGALLAIREHNDASAEERAITLCNAGIMALAGAQALSLLEAVGNANAKGEYYLTDVVEIARARGLKTVALEADEAEVQGINTRVQLAEVEASLQKRLRTAAMVGGVTLIAPETVFFSADTRIAPDVVVEPHVVFGPGVVVESDAVIHAFSHLEGAHVAAGASVGPYARLRPGTRLGAGARAGNFVEVKNATVMDGAKINHLSYIGDAEVGERANIGAGTITCNYDGVSKHKTVIGKDAFVGSNSALVAPVRIGDGAYVGSGSVIVEDVPNEALAVARGRQAVKPDWASKRKK